MRSSWWGRWPPYQLGQSLLTRLARIERAQSDLNRKVDSIMTKQDDLNALVARIDVAVTGIRQDVADLKAAHPEIDFSALEERVAGLEGLDAENPGTPPQG
jgi:outer membrane murein-binding lipoprotein Lpp